MLQCVALCCSVPRCVAVCCSVLQCVAVCCSVMQCVAAYCSVLQCVAVCYSLSQCVAVCRSVNACLLLQRRNAVLHAATHSRMDSSAFWLLQHRNSSTKPPNNALQRTVTHCNTDIDTCLCFMYAHTNITTPSLVHFPPPGLLQGV